MVPSHSNLLLTMKSFQLRIRPDVKKGLGILLMLTITWHLFIGLKSRISLAGLFMAKPEPGYLWNDSKTAERRFFAENLETAWEAGTPHSEFNAQTTASQGIWEPLPGYKFIDQSKDLSTVWTPGLLHPDFQAWSDTGEGLWIPATGYKFVYEGDEFVATVWDPNKRYEELKIISLPEQDSFIPFPGYQFVSPGKTFEVVWTPGLVNPDNTRLVSGAKEGSWEVSSRRSYGRAPNWLEKEIVRGVIYRVF